MTISHVGAAKQNHTDVQWNVITFHLIHEALIDDKFDPAFCNLVSLCREPNG